MDDKQKMDMWGMMEICGSSDPRENGKVNEGEDSLGTTYCLRKEFAECQTVLDFLTLA